MGVWIGSWIYYTINSLIAPNYKKGICCHFSAHFTVYYCADLSLLSFQCLLPCYANGVRWLLVTANIVPSSPILVTLMMEVLCSSETSVCTRPTWCNIPEDGILHSHRCENVRSYTALLLLHHFDQQKIPFIYWHLWAAIMQ
jgi:hypothetical protein